MPHRPSVHEQLQAADAAWEAASLLPSATAPPSEFPPPAYSKANALSGWRRSVYILTSLSLLLSLVTLAFAIATLIDFASHWVPLPFGMWYNGSGAWYAQGVDGICVTTGLATLLSFFNLVRLRLHNRPLPLPLNLPFDLAIGVCTPFYAIQILRNPGLYHASCQDRSNIQIDETRLRNWACHRATTKAETLLVVVTIVAAISVALVHLILMVFRGIATLRHRFWGQPWRIPACHFAFEFTIKPLRAQQDTSK